MRHSTQLNAPIIYNEANSAGSIYGNPNTALWRAGKSLGNNTGPGTDDERTDDDKTLTFIA
jgi:hypothetical protein